MKRIRVFFQQVILPDGTRLERKISFPRTIYAVYSVSSIRFPLPSFLPLFSILRVAVFRESRRLSNLARCTRLTCPVLSCPVLFCPVLPSFLPWRKIISREGNGGKPCRLTTRGEGNSRDTASASVRFSRASGRETMPLKRRLCSTGKQRRNKNVLIHPPSVIPPSRDDLSLFFHFFLPLSLSLDLGFRDGCIKSRSKGHAFTVMQPFSFEHTRT